MAKNLIIVESPAKARTITKYLGRDFTALASYGHVRDLLPKTGAVDPEQQFAMQYSEIDRNKKHIDAIAREIRKSDALYLATDPDREGEAISWHLLEILKERDALDSKPVFRVVFYEFTKQAIQEAIESPRELSSNLVNAQQARRALDYLVGFNLSPLLWKKVRPGLSAGRVQSPALRLIAERDEEIAKFKPREYWTVESDLRADDYEFVAKLAVYDDEKLGQFSIDTDQQARTVTQRLERDAAGKLTVSSVERKQRRRNPAPPFTTSTLQQEASRKLGFRAQRTMQIAQQLYEGVELDGELVGLITYMRTDAVNLADSAVQELRSLIESRYGADHLPNAPQVYRNKSKNAQEAHEAIRATDPLRSPEAIRPTLSADQQKLYELIWKRTVACQMVHAILNTVAVDFRASAGNFFRATGSSIAHPGFMTVYQEGSDDKNNDAAKEVMLPNLSAGQVVELLAIRPEQHFTEPPPRYTEASLVKTLEAYGIGRPSTYASIMATLVNREYVSLENRRFESTDVGKVVNRFLTNHFARYVDYDFTANLEDELDSVSRGEKSWLPVMSEFWEPFNELLKEKEESVSREEAVQARELGVDPKSGRPMTVRMGRYGPCVQIGTKDDDEKWKFAGLRPGQSIDSISFDEAIDLFRLPRDLGITPEGDSVSANIGRFGPFVKYGSKYVSLKDEDPYTVNLERALELIREKQQLDANRIIQSFGDGSIQVLNGRYGPYVTDGEKNARIPKQENPTELTREQCEELLVNAPAKRRGRKSAAKSATNSSTKSEAKIKSEAKAKAKKKTKKKAKKKAKKKTNFKEKSIDKSAAEA